MVQLSDGSKTNIGLSLKFESKGLKVLGFSKRNDRGWEFSETTALALERYKAAFPEAFHNLDSRGGGEFSRCPTSEHPDQIVKDMKRWLKAQDLVDLETASLFAEQLEKVGDTFSRVGSVGSW
jgi:5'-3' exoribonuclease 1